jgi:hypothetical protein
LHCRFGKRSRGRGEVRCGIGTVLRDQNDNHYWLTRAWFVAPLPGLTGRADEILVNQRIRNI